MRGTDERMAELTRRVKKAEREKAKRSRRVLALGSVSACLALIVAASFTLPGVTERLMGKEYVYAGPAASVFTESAALGFIVIGALAFALGICVTVFCYRLRRWDREDEHGRDN